MKNPRPRILIVSSANMDLAANVSRVPASGESMVGIDYDYIPGGKGANSALTLARLGADSIFCAKLGDDANGYALTNYYKKNNIDTRFITLDRKEKTGLAIVIVDGNGNNRILVYPGANYALSESDVENAFTCYPDALFLHLEIPMDTVIAATNFAEKHKIPVFIDAGPAVKSFPLEELKNVTVFSPNETETLIFTGIDPRDMDSRYKACSILFERVKAKYIILKLGDKGAFFYDGTHYDIFPPHNVDVVDTTAAGDAFTAALALEYMRSGGDIKRACKYANIVGSITVSRAGASSSIPTVAEITEFIYENNIPFRL
jgi:ribokinase